MRNRGSVVLIKDNKVGLIKRVQEDSVYYVFPGGGIENGETPEEGAKREALEELVVTVKVGECIATIDFNGTQYFFLAEIILAQGKVKSTQMRKDNEEHIYRCG